MTGKTLLHYLCSPNPKDGSPGMTPARAKAAMREAKRCGPRPGGTWINHARRLYIGQDDLEHLTHAEQDAVCIALEHPTVGVKALAELSGVTRDTFYRHIKAAITKATARLETNP